MMGLPLRSLLDGRVRDALRRVAAAASMACARHSAARGAWFVFLALSHVNLGAPGVAARVGPPLAMRIWFVRAASRVGAAKTSG